MEEETREKTRKRNENLARKKALEEHWDMMKWLNKYIRENQCTWEKRRLIEEKKREHEEKMNRWNEKRKEEQIKEIEEKEKDEEAMERKRKEKAQVRNEGWKTWRKGGREDDQKEKKE